MGIGHLPAGRSFYFDLSSNLLSGSVVQHVCLCCPSLVFSAHVSHIIISPFFVCLSVCSPCWQGDRGDVGLVGPEGPKVDAFCYLPALVFDLSNSTLVIAMLFWKKKESREIYR